MSSLADRPNTEAEAARRCSQPYGTHWDGCPCSLIRLDNEIQALRAELEIVRDDRETYRRAWMREESERSAAQAQIAELRAALEQQRRMQDELERVRGMLRAVTNDPNVDLVGFDLDERCHYCGADFNPDLPHKDDCPWMAARAYLADVEVEPHDGFG